MNNSPINSTINSTTVVELADASSLNYVDRIFLILTLPPTFNDKFTTEVYVVSLTFG